MTIWARLLTKLRSDIFRRTRFSEYDETIAECSEAICPNPQDSIAYVNRGTNCHKKGEYDKAIADFNEAIRLDPQNAKAYYNRGLARANTREYDKSIADHTEVIRLAPPHAKVKRSTVSSQQINLMNIQSRARYARSLAWAGKGEYDKAIADCNEAICLDPQYVDGYVGRGLCWHKEGEYDKAIADFNEALRLAPQSADAYNNRGNACVNKGEYDKALADYSETIRLDPLDARAYNNRGIAWRRKGKYHEAIANYTQAIRLGPDTATRYTTFAWLLATSSDGRYRDGARAVRLAEKACKITDFSDADSLYVLAAAHAENRNFSDAVSWQRKALDLAAPDERADMHARMELYEAGKPYHEE